MSAVPADDSSAGLPAATDVDMTLELDARQLQDQDIRVYLPFPARVRGRDSSGARFELPCVLDSLGPRDLALQLPLPVAVGAEFAIVIKLSTDPAVPGPRVAVRGAVQHVERRKDGRYGVVVGFSRHRFLYSAPPTP
ncbi:MAG TPA: hypothetical protein VM536_01570 [Chloroflexia bacterium]|nr:hypothetical protein [Chloroflexia bacterium]